MRKIALALVLLASVAEAQSKKKPDKPVTYIVNLTRPEDKKPTLLSIPLPERFWQHADHPVSWAPGTAVRNGWGTAWLVSEDYFSDIYHTHVFLEIEELGNRTLKDAADDHRKAIPEICEKGLEKLRGKVGKLKRAKKFRLGRTKRAAYTVSYKITPQGVQENASDVAKALLFEVNGYVIVITVVKFGATDYFPVVSGRISVTDKWPTKPVPYKHLDLIDGVSKFFTFEIPPELRRVYRYDNDRLAARWEQRGKDGELLARLSLAVTNPHGVSVADFVKKRAENYRDHYDKVSDVKQLKVESRKGLWLTFVDGSKEEDPAVRHVCKAFYEYHRAVWTWTYEVLGEDPKRIAAAPKLIEKLLGNAVMWRSRAE